MLYVDNVKKTVSIRIKDVGHCVVEDITNALLVSGYWVKHTPVESEGYESYIDIEIMEGK